MTIESLLSQAECHPEYFPQATPDQVSAVVRIARTRVANLKIALKPIRAIRNMLLAHLDATLIHDPTRMAEHTRVTFTDLNQVFFFAGNILNEVAVKFRDTMADFDFVDGLRKRSSTRRGSKVRSD